MASQATAESREEYGLGWWGEEGELFVGTPESTARERDATPAAIPLLAVWVEKHGGTLFRVAHAVLRSRPDAEDVVQETFLRAMRQQDLEQIRDARVWLVRIAWRLALDRKRRLRPEQMDRIFAESLVSRELPADVAFTEMEQLARVLRVMDRLPQAERETLLLAATEEMSTAEMAAVLGRSESAVRALLCRARTRLKDRLRKEERR